MKTIRDKLRALHRLDAPHQGPSAPAEVTPPPSGSPVLPPPSPPVPLAARPSSGHAPQAPAPARSLRATEAAPPASHAPKVVPSSPRTDAGDERVSPFASLRRALPQRLPAAEAARRVEPPQRTAWRNLGQHLLGGVSAAAGPAPLVSEPGPGEPDDAGRMDVLGGRLERQVADPRGVVNAGKSAAEGPGARPQLHAPPARGGWAAAAAVEQPDAASRLGVGGYRWVCAQGSCEVRHVVVQVPAVVPEPGADPLVRWAAGHTLPLARRWLVMDIESTGLSRRTSLPVVVGVLYAEAPDRLHIEQAWLRSPDEEPALLAWWLSTLGRFEELVTYNGRNFDLRLLRSRLKVHGMPSAAMDALGERTGKPGAPHLDLLLWLRAQRSHGLPRLRLTDVEEGLLGLVREGDPGGAAVATLLQASLAAERCPPNEVFLHNQLDLIAVHRACSHLALPARS